MRRPPYKRNEIYVLIDPRDGEVRYVGITICGILNRTKGHIRQAQQISCQTYKSRWIRTLLEIGLKPAVKLIAIVHPWENWKEKEIYWISYYKSLGSRLTNASIGGEGAPGYKHTEEAKLKIREAAKASPHGFKKGIKPKVRKCEPGCTCKKHKSQKGKKRGPAWNKGILNSTNAHPVGCICDAHLLRLSQNCRPGCTCYIHSILSKRKDAA